MKPKDKNYTDTEGKSHVATIFKQFNNDDEETEEEVDDDSV